MPLYKDLNELINGHPQNWVNAINAMQTKDADAIVREIPEKKMKELPAEKVIQLGQVIGEKCVKSKLKYSQLRRFVDEIKSIEMSDDRINKLKLFRIPLLHGYSRQPDALKPFYQFVDGLIKLNKIQDDEDFEKFVLIIDAITAVYEALRKDDDES